MTKLHRYLLPLIATVVASADGNMSRPVAGYAIDCQSRLRPIFGVPGAFTFGDPFTPPSKSRVWLVPGQNFALSENSSGAIEITSLSGAAVTDTSPIPSITPSPDWIVISPGAGSALLFFAGARRVQVVAGLPQAPRVVVDQDVSSQENLTNGAVSDDGNTVLLASASTVYRLSGGQFQIVFSPGTVTSLTILRNGLDAAFADAAGSVYQIRNLTNPQVLATGLTGIGTIFPGSDGKSLFVARPGDRSITLIDLASGGVHTFATPVPAVTWSPLRNRDTFLIASKAHEPGWVFLWDGTAGRVVLIPAPEPDGNHTAGDNQ